MLWEISAATNLQTATNIGSTDYIVAMTLISDTQKKKQNDPPLQNINSIIISQNSVIFLRPKSMSYCVC